ncbi:hypothetical protein [Afipia carboxidovorans]|uniref:hypothetical protein n=1 Tax=Afipia carboxidovorans TaxID=40137 RepID=UPI0030938664|nr:hypothetical protein CRBSH125_00970 [Afipia carboxidovorans]
MAVPSWPSGIPYESLKDGFSNSPFLTPIQTEMEQGNVRLRRRPGDNVAIIQQSIPMTRAEYETLVAWGKGTIGNWTGRFSTLVWLGSSYQTKVCQFQDGAPKPLEFSPTHVAVQMTLRVYGV